MHQRLKVILSNIIACIVIVKAIKENEANVTDFHIKTCGHGSISSLSYYKSTSNQFQSTTKPNVLLSSGSSSNACYLCSRDVNTGNVIWRKNICDSSTTAIITTSSRITRKNIAYSSNAVVTLSNDGIVKRWNVNDGHVTHEILIDEAYEVMTFQNQFFVVVTKRSDKLFILNENLQELTQYDIPKVFAKKIRGISATSSKTLKLVTAQGNYFIFAFLNDSFDETTALSNLIMMQFDLEKMDITNISSLKGVSHGNLQVKLNTIGIVDQILVAALMNGGCWLFSDVYGSKTYPAFSLVQAWTKVTKLVIHRNFVSISGYAGGTLGISSGLFEIRKENNILSLKSLNESVLRSDKIATYSTKDHVFVAMFALEEEEEVRKYVLDLYILGDENQFDLISRLSNSNISGDIDKISLTCVDQSSVCYVLATTTVGTTYQFSSSEEMLSLDWVKEEALGSISNALIIESDFQTQTHAIQDKMVYFGFQKLVLLLSSLHNVVFGINTIGDAKGSILYKTVLPSAATRHTLVQGNLSSRSGVHGAFFSNSKQSAQYVLILSFFDNHAVEWRCLHSSSGDISNKGEIILKQKVTSIFPIWNDDSFEVCPQSALLLLEDDSIVMIPANKDYGSFISRYPSKDGIYFHSVNKETGLVQSYKLAHDFKLDLIGKTFFDPEQEIITNVYYPSRNEVVQSPSIILGDDSLLLKYLNPHIMVIVSESTPEYLAELEKKESIFFNAFSESAGRATSKRKPLGATVPSNSTSTASAPSTNIPTLFVTIVDTISCRVLHRASHSHKTSAHSNSLSDVPLVISENWIVYSFFNHKSQRTELSVLTLYEGMIDKHGITAFQEPDQELEFDSFTFPKPIVLQKSYTLAKRVTSLGVTHTSRGIASKQFLVCFGDMGWIYTMDSRILDPRRPNSEEKSAEKLEGLIRYTPLLLVITKNIISYNLVVENPLRVISSPAKLESQSLVFAFGGPDLFFTRLAPSKGFDLLPENFNKSLVGILVFVLLGVVIYLKKKSERKMLSSAWA